VSQYKSSVIQRKSELLGYKLAIESIGKSSLSVTESAVWLNTILHKLWRVKSGGLEPRISSSAGAILADILKQPYSKPSVVAYVALDAFTFGSSPPIVTRIEMKGFDDDQSALYMDVDVGMLLHDAVLLLDIKPSSLEYRSLPSTKGQALLTGACNDCIVYFSSTFSFCLFALSQKSRSIHLMQKLPLKYLSNVLLTIHTFLS